MMIYAKVGAVAIVSMCLVAHAEVKTLVWNGGEDAPWNCVDQNWLDGNTPTAWINGSDARFETEGAQVFVSPGLLHVRRISVAPTVEVKPIVTGVEPATDTEAELVEGERGLAWGTLLPRNATDWTTVWRNRQLSSIKGIGYAVINDPDGDQVGCGYFWRYDPATDTATVQIQPDKFRDTQICMTDLKFRQQGSDIEVAILGSQYRNANYKNADYHAEITTYRASTYYPVKNICATTYGSELVVDADGGFYQASGLMMGVRIADRKADTQETLVSGQRELEWAAKLGNDWKTVWKNRRLRDLGGIDYAVSTKTEGTASGDARGYFWAYDAANDTATVQIQNDYFTDAQMVACNVEFKQEGEDIMARITGAGYASSRHYGTDDYHAYVQPREAYAANPAGYMTVSALLAQEGGGQLTVDYSLATENATVTMKPTMTEPIVIWKNSRLADLTGVEGTQYSTSGELANLSYGFENDGTTASVQLQRKCAVQTDTEDGLITYVNLVFTQQGNDIAVQVVGAGYHWFYKYQLATDPQVFPYSGFPRGVVAGGPSTSADYYTKPGWLKGYFGVMPVKLSCPIDSLTTQPKLVSGGLEFTGANTFNFAWPLAVESEYKPIVFSDGARAVFPAGATNTVGKAGFAGVSTLVLPTGAAFEAASVALDAALVVVDADYAAKPVRIGTSKCLTADEAKSFTMVDGGWLKQDGEGYLIARDGMVVILL